MTENKPLTEAQRQHFRMLIAERQKIEAEIQRFVTYLVQEHNAPESEGWTSIDAEKGFVRETPTGQAVGG